MATRETNSSATTPSGSSKKIAFTALHNKDFRAYFVATMLAMMADNIEHVVSYWLFYEKCRSLSPYWLLLSQGGATQSSTNAEPWL